MMRGEDGGVGGGQGLVGSCMGGNGEMAPGQKLVPDASLGSKWAGHRERHIESQLLRLRGNGGAVPDSHPNRRTSQPATRRPVFQFVKDTLVYRFIRPHVPPEGHMQRAQPNHFGGRDFEPQRGIH